jgi:hypothetical protein
MRGHRQEAADAANLVDGDDRLEALGLLILGPGEMQHRWMRPDGDLAKERRVGIGHGQFGRSILVPREFQQVIGQMEGERRLADAERAGEEQRMR